MNDGTIIEYCTLPIQSSIIIFLIEPITRFSSVYILLSMASPSSHTFSIFIIFFVHLSSKVSCSEYMYPNFTASNRHFVDVSGAFLFSHNGTFKASMYNPNKQQNNFYLCIIHAASNMIIWSANRDASVSSSGKMILSLAGIEIFDEYGESKWSTPKLKSSVFALHLSELGNLVLLDKSNASLWDSFHAPTDAIVIGQQLPVGTLLKSSVSDDVFSTGNYSLTVTKSDALLQWQGLTYWKLSMDLNAFKNSNYVVEYLALTRTGLYLYGHDGSDIVIQVSLSASDFRIAKLDASGQLIVSSYSDSSWEQDFVGPSDKCGMPLICGSVGLCTDSASNNPLCACPPGFHVGPRGKGCTPSNSSLSLPSACDSTINNDASSANSDQVVSYLGLQNGSDYFSNKFLDPVKYGVNLSACKDLCSQDCSCLGVFYESKTGSCFKLQHQLASIMSTTSGDRNERMGFIKAVGGYPPTGIPRESSTGRRQLIALVIFPLLGFFLLIFLLFFWWKTWKKRSSSALLKLDQEPDSSTSDVFEAFSIPGLPIRYEYEELITATDNFSTQIGAGGFGAVYKGTLPDQTRIAVKKLTILGVQGKKEFCTEIAIIGNIHHINLVKLKGFCAQGRERLLVYEYMNRSSLDRTLFGTGPVLEWQERYDIALGTARGLAYLHSGCEHKIIHCDVKPENILLHDHFVPKISDFGLSKLLSPEQSGHFTTMRGTRGYLAPEWLTSSAISEKTDVYSYGMVLFEIVSGRKNCSSTQILSHSLKEDNIGSAAHETNSTSGSGIVYFPILALEMHEQGRYLGLADPRLEGRVSGEEVEKLVRIGLCCVHEEPSLRPSMVNVVGMLEGRVALCHPRLESLNFLRFYGHRFAEASAVEDGNQQSGLMLCRAAANGIGTTSSSGSQSAISYLSSQQISGPR